MKLAITQGRLSPKERGKIQSFPTKNWQKEFKIASSLGLKNIEWVIDFDTIHSNPIFNEKGFKKIKQLCKKYNISIKTIQCDFILHKPFWKRKYEKYKTIIDKKIDFLFKINNLSKSLIFIIPLLERSKISCKKEENFIIGYFKSKTNILKKHNNKVAFEIDYSPKKLKKYIHLFNKKYFGINYDTGNSISNKFDYNKEMDFYLKRIMNIHYKDKNKFKKSVYLGDGKFNYSDFYKRIKHNYKGLITLQAARSDKVNDIELIKDYLFDLKNSQLSTKLKIGIMQGRTKIRKKYNLCPKNWSEEFKIAQTNNFKHIEMIVDKNLSSHNPIVKNLNLNKKIKEMSYSINVDYYVHNKINKKNIYLLSNVINFAEKNKFKIIVLPLIEKSKLNNNELNYVIKYIKNLLKNSKIKIALELDYNLDRIFKIKSSKIGICYDIGNLNKKSNIYEDIKKYKNKIIHFHFKDYKNKYRSNFPDGNINFNKLIGVLKYIKYKNRITFEGLNGIKNNLINKKYLEQIG